MVRRESGRLRSNSLTDLFATAVGSKSHWYRRKGFGGSLASLSGSLSGSMPQLNAMQWNEEDSTPRSLPPEFGVSRVKLDPRTHTPPVRRKSEPLVCVLALSLVWVLLFLIVGLAWWGCEGGVIASDRARKHPRWV